MDRMKTFFKYFVIVLVFYIFTNIVTANIMKPQVADSSSGAEVTTNAEFDWEKVAHDPVFWFIALGGLIVTLP